MITHKAFYEKLNNAFTHAVLLKKTGRNQEAFEILDHAIVEIDVHSKNTISTPPFLLKLERDILRVAYGLSVRESVK